MAEPAFPSPLAVHPPGCEGWEEMYPHYALFSEERRAFEESRFWFQEALHWPGPIHPFDAVLVEALFLGLNQASTRTFAIPPSLGAEYRVLGGYVYSSPSTVADDDLLARRAELFEQRGGHYYEHWDELHSRWVSKVERAIRELRALEVPDLPEFEDEAIVTEGRGYGSSHVLLAAYAHLMESLDRVIQYHFELLNLGYGAYVVLYELCRGAFPDITDQTIAKLVSGVDLLSLRPDAELRRLAKAAMELGVAEEVKLAEGEDELRWVLDGNEWLSRLDAAKDPWFCFSNGNGLASHYRSWIDDTTVPLATIASYITRLEAGESISRPYDAHVAERDRITAEYRALLPQAMRRRFDESVALARGVFPHVEDHSFYIDHWYLTIFWNKVREFGALLARHGYLGEADDVFYLRHGEVREALEELRLAWSSGVGPATGPARWPAIVARRKSMREALRRWTPPIALGSVPENIDDPVTNILFGITAPRIQAWLAAGEDPDGRTLRGVGASSGFAEGPARLVRGLEQLAMLEDGDILVAATTSPSWSAAFSRVAGVVVDVGGIMSHAAIVAREYGLPTVVGTGSAMTTIKTGDRVRVDGHTGVVTIVG